MNIMKWDFEKKTPLNQSGVFIKYAKRSFIKNDALHLTFAA